MRHPGLFEVVGAVAAGTVVILILLMVVWLVLWWFWNPAWGCRPMPAKPRWFSLRGFWQRVWNR